MQQGGLLSLLGIDPRDKRDQRNREAEIDAQSRGLLAVEQERGRGTIANTREQGDQARKSARSAAREKILNARGFSQDDYDSRPEVKAAVDAMLAIKGRTGITDAETGEERGRQNKFDANKGSEARGLTPLNPVRAQPPTPPNGVGNLSGQAFQQGTNALGPTLGAMMQAKVAAAPQYQAPLRADPAMMQGIRAAEVARASMPAIAAAKASEFSAGPGTVTQQWGPDGPNKIGGALQRPGITPSPFPGTPPTVSEGQELPTFAPSGLMANMPKTPPQAGTNSVAAIPPAKGGFPKAAVKPVTPLDAFQQQQLERILQAYREGR